MKLTKKDLKPMRDVINTLTEQYPETAFSLEIRNYNKEKLPEFFIYASDSWVKPCGSSHCYCGDVKNGGKINF